MFPYDPYDPRNRPPGSIPSLNPFEVSKPIHGMHERGQNAALMSWMKSNGIDINPANTAWCAAFVNSVLDFVIVAASIFVAIRAMNRLRKKEEAKPPEPSVQEKLLTEIRDLLRAGR